MYEICICGQDFLGENHKDLYDAELCGGLGDIFATHIAVSVSASRRPDGNRGHPELSACCHCCTCAASPTAKVCLVKM